MHVLSEFQKKANRKEKSVVSEISRKVILYFLEYFLASSKEFNILAFPGCVLLEWGCCRYLCTALIQGVGVLVLRFFAFSIHSLTKNCHSRSNFIKSTKLVYPSSYCPDGIREHWSPRRRLLSGSSLSFALDPLELHLIRFCNVST